MQHKNSIKDNTPTHLYQKIGEIAGAALGKPPVSKQHVARCINSYPVCPYKNDTVFLAVIAAALQAVGEYNKTKSKIGKKVAALPKHAMALTELS